MTRIRTRVRITLGRGFFVGLLVPVAFVGASEPAFAQSAEERATARSLMALGQELFERGKFEEALEAFTKADEIVKVPTTGLARARALEKLNRWKEAMKVYLRVRDSKADPDEPAVFTAARKQAKTESDALLERIPKVTIEVEGLAAGVEPTVFLDGTKLAPAAQGQPMRLDPGKYGVRVEADGYETTSYTFELHASDKITVALRMHVKEPPPDPQPSPPKAPPNPP